MSTVSKGHEPRVRLGVLSRRSFVRVNPEQGFYEVLGTHADLGPYLFRFKADLALKNVIPDLFKPFAPAASERRLSGEQQERDDSYGPNVARTGVVPFNNFGGDGLDGRKERAS